MRLLAVLLVLALLGSCDSTPPAAETVIPQPSDDDLIGSRFAKIQPFFERYCFGCHGAKKPKGDLDLSRDFSVAAIAKNPKQWDLVLARLRDREMPPEDAKHLPGAGERDAAIAVLREIGDREAKRHAGDPGVVLARRLSNAEYDYTIRDLTGFDLRPTREFPVDPANEAGFDNSGESLTMSEALLRKYLAAARHVSDHVVLKPGGFVFAPHPVVTDTDRDKYCVQRIVEFYRRHDVDYAKYFAALRRRQDPGAAGLSPKYLFAIDLLLRNPPPAGSPVEELWTQWEGGADPETLAATVTRLRATFPAREERLEVKGISRGSQPFILWRNDQLAAQHRSAPAGADAGVVRFCRTFPDAFVVLERGPYYDKSSSPKGRYLSAGFHLMQGYYRDDGPLCELVLSKDSRAEIDALWGELHFISQDALRQYKDFIFFERAEPPRFMFDAAFDFARSEDKDATSSAKIGQLQRAYLLRAGQKGASEAALTAIQNYFTAMDARIREIDELRRNSEPQQLASLQTFAARAFRRPLIDAERESLLKYYDRLRSQELLSHEEAFRDVLASILLSPKFLYRCDLTRAGALSSEELASRLSYFLWSSMPDRELLESDLTQPEVLALQAQRLLRDPKIRGLATEFAGNWLDFRRFEEHNAVDRDRFPQFTNELRQAMFEEPVRFFSDIARQNRPILDFLYGQDTFVNPVLAKHYGIPIRQQDWVQVEDARPYGRGGLLPMAVFLTKNAPGLRTSPVKRGYWVVRRLLGEQIPPPPPTVPALPKDEAVLGDLTLPQALERHRNDPACAGCHRRFDSFGLAFEGYGPIGEKRDKDLGGKPVQDGDGLRGLLSVLREKRQQDFINNLSQKLLSYALGRGLLPSDRDTIERMKRQERFGGLIHVIVTSPQFLNRRGQP